jgi:hypothetical protein
MQPAKVGKADPLLVGIIALRELWVRHEGELAQKGRRDNDSQPQNRAFVAQS